MQLTTRRKSPFLHRPTDSREEQLTMDDVTRELRGEKLLCRGQEIVRYSPRVRSD